MNISKFTAKVSSMHTRNAWVQLKEGRNRFRFLCQNSEEDPWVETYRHFIPKEFTVENFPRVPLCLGTDCPACALVEEFRKRGNNGLPICSGRNIGLYGPSFSEILL